MKGFVFRIRDLASSIGKNGYKVAPVFEALGPAVISQCVLSDGHIGLLLQVCMYATATVTKR